MKNLIIILTFFIACKGQNRAPFKPDFITAPPTVVYKTKANYNNLVPVLLSDDKKQIISYPHPTDIKIGDKFASPTILSNGYLLDNRGIGKNVAFLKLTYEQYSKLENAPALSELYELIIDKDPLNELCDCGNKKAFTDQTKQLNKLIKTGKLRSTCRTIM